MRNQTESRFPPLYAIILFVSIVCAELVSEWTGNSLLHRITKPLIMLSLLLFAISEMRGNLHPAKVFLFCGMLCGMIGDMLLMFKSDISWAVEGGMLAFLLGHIFYIITYRTGSKGSLELNLWWIASFLLYGIVSGYFLFSHTGAMLMPLIVYALVLFAMAIIAKERQARVPMRSYRLVWFGALAFIASDSILAIHLFVRSSPIGGILLMALYAGAQLCICLGMLEQMRSEIV
jgi:uncharacterized membrane protein YhhN